MEFLLGSASAHRMRLAFLRLLEALPDVMHRVPVPTGIGFQGIGFQVPLDRTEGNFSLSIAFPFDYGLAETMLFEDGSMTTNDSWGYSDVRRDFGSGDPSDPATIDALAAEILRLRSSDPGDPDAPSDVSSDSDDDQQ